MQLSVVQANYISRSIDKNITTRSLYMLLHKFKSVMNIDLIKGLDQDAILVRKMFFIIQHDMLCYLNVDLNYIVRYNIFSNIQWLVLIDK